MKCYKLLYCGFFSFVTLLYSGNSDQQTLTLSYPTLNDLSVKGSVSITVFSSDPGRGGAGGEDDTTTYSFFSNEDLSGNNKKIVGKLDTNMPANTLLEVELFSGVGISVEAVELTDTNKDLVTDIPQLSSVTDEGILVTFVAFPGAQSGSINRTITYTFQNQ